MWDERSDGGCWVWDAQNVVVSHDLQRLMEFMGVPNLKECRRRTLCYFYLEKGLVWWGGKKKKFGPFLDLCVSSLRRGHANLLCIVPILSDVSEETSFNSGVSIYEETYLVLKFRCGMGMGMSRPPAAQNDAVSLNLHRLYVGPQLEKKWLVLKQRWAL
ncbi:uncharacterized protein LOC117915931 [Vitis riparia]|uniref:uncharacterized protein LOC117915931 n=1 Tax=Vitis riparia TaxID=96939 RepID=UPI00155A8776|nr:uncharacterized protein LOC117915931 [Vitis riparia]